MTDFVIEKMEESDREAIREICCDTGNTGKDIRPLIDDENLFADIWTLYYTDYEPQSAFVARVGGKTVGYLTGCLDTRHFNRVFSRKLIPLIIFKAARGHYRLGSKTLIYLKNILSQLLKGKVYPPLHLYPAHLHININIAS